MKDENLGELLIIQGGAIKALGDGKIGGHLVVFGDQRNLDLEGDYFTADTDFDLFEGKKSSIYYQHGWDPVLKRRRLGRGDMKQDDIGIWIEAQLEMRDEYEEAIYALVEEAKLGWSSGTAPHLMEREQKSKGYWISSWPLGMDASLTPTPAEPKTQAISIKSYQGVDLLKLSAEDTRSQEGDKVEAELEKKKQAAVAVILGG